MVYYFLLVVLLVFEPEYNETITTLMTCMYRKVAKFSDARKLCCNLPKNQTQRPNLRVFCQKDANGISNSEDRDQTAPPGAPGAV